MDTLLRSAAVSCSSRRFFSTMATQSLTSNLPQTRPRKPPNSAPRSSESRQVRKLTENLLNTYREINDAYYKCVWSSARRLAGAQTAALRRKKQERNKEKDSQKDTEFEIKEGQVLNGRYRVQNALGKGSFGQVRIAPCLALRPRFSSLRRRYLEYCLTAGCACC